MHSSECGHEFGSDYTAYGRVGWGRLGVTTQGAALDEVNDRMAALCTDIKAQGVILYTITFQLSNTRTQNLFRNCATSDEHYFNSPNNADLQAAFREIGTKLSQLRLRE